MFIGTLQKTSGNEEETIMLTNLPNKNNLLQTIGEVRDAVDHKNISSTRQYAKVEVSRRLEILEHKVISIGGNRDKKNC